jgi:hypothetical protein
MLGYFHETYSWWSRPCLQRSSSTIPAETKVQSWTLRTEGVSRVKISAARGESFTIIYSTLHFDKVYSGELSDTKFPDRDKTKQQSVVQELHSRTYDQYAYSVMAWRKKDTTNLTPPTTSLKFHHDPLAILSMYLQHMRGHLLGRFNPCTERQLHGCAVPGCQCHDIGRVEHCQPFHAQHFSAGDAVPPHICGLRNIRFGFCGPSPQGCI